MILEKDKLVFNDEVVPIVYIQRLVIMSNGKLSIDYTKPGHRTAFGRKKVYRRDFYYDSKDLLVERFRKKFIAVIDFS